ncbi:hypothetical protein SFC88_03915 [Nocardioides sp. HM23]|uniref:hypothetical protein n=1 Tax=Nocardioides bizhenqiangii TaxID=3095076 RepID=UPI002ACA3EF9|nr:hypothetical protein [Nocardioides sp. HM23]MDZ5619956.1 hypothetical protein [Nocardioides sp. HM23]
MRSPSRRQCAGAAALAAALTFATGCSGEPDEDPETVVQAVVDARTSGDCDDYADHFVDGDVVGGCTEGDADPVVGDGPEVGEATVGGDEAEVEVVDHYDCSTWDEPDVESVDVYFLVVDDGEWLVDDIDFAETTSDDCFT